MKEWLTLEEMSQAASYNNGTLQRRTKQGKIPDMYYKWENNRHYYHRDLIPWLKARKAEWEQHQEDINPHDVVPYDGYLLRPEEIERLELVRRQNGYRAAHWTNKTLAELIAMGGDNQAYASN